MFLGPITVRSSSKDIQLKVKEEYNAYRVRMFLIALCFCPIFNFCLWYSSFWVSFIYTEVFGN